MMIFDNGFWVYNAALPLLPLMIGLIIGYFAKSKEDHDEINYYKNRLDQYKQEVSK